MPGTVIEAPGQVDEIGLQMMKKITKGDANNGISLTGIYLEKSPWQLPLVRSLRPGLQSRC